MTVLLGVLCGTAATFGVVAMVWALVGPEPAPRPRSSVRPVSKLVDGMRGMSRGEAMRLAAGLGIGALSAWYLAMPLGLVLVPLAFWGLPRLLSDPPQAEVKRLEALDRWVRGMTATLSTGKSITDALRLSVRQAPALLQEALLRLVKRLDDRWTPGHALAAMADELDSADTDAVIAALILSVQRGGSGAASTLAALADSIQDRLRALREVEAERAKPRIVVRQVTIVTLVMLGLALVFARDYFTPYGTPLGQVILATLLAIYVGSLVMLRRMTLPRRRERILRSVA